MKTLVQRMWRSVRRSTRLGQVCWLALTLAIRASSHGGAGKQQDIASGQRALKNAALISNR